jgi:uncharacterized protein
MTRRDFLELAVALTVAPAVARGARTEPVARRKLGRTGETVSVIGLGGSHIGSQDLPEAQAIRLMHAAIDAGITFFDNCWDYNGGASEERMGKALAGGKREQVFLMTKIDGRDAATARRQIDESLRRLRTDRLDLLQLHEVIRPEDPPRAAAAGGALEALAEAKRAGKARFLGFTGHKHPDLHLAMLRAWEAHGGLPDTVQMPLNVMDAHHESFEKKVLPVLLEKGIGVLGMKPMGSPYILESRTVPAEDCLRYALSLPTSVVITGLDSQKVLDQAIRVARGFRPLPEREIAALLKRTEAAARDGKFERYKSSTHFDGTTHHPEWLG